MAPGSKVPEMMPVTSSMRLIKSAMLLEKIALGEALTSDSGSGASGGLIGAFRGEEHTESSAPAVPKAIRPENTSSSSTSSSAAASAVSSATHASTNSVCSSSAAATVVSHNSSSTAAAAAATTAAPRARAQTKLLALCPTVPPSMQRDVWCIADYTITQKLYTGYASKVYKAICKRTNEVVVLKSYQLSAICELYQHQIFREVGLHASLMHENVVTLYAAFQEGDFVIMVQEFADGGDLFSLLQKYGGRLSERVAVSLVLEPFLRVLQYLHTRGIVHRDIKPENILFSSSMCLKLADFGLAIDLRHERAVTRAGTLDYMAPEVLNCPYKNHPEENKEKAHLHYGSTVDSWAVGVLAYELLVGCPPFYEQSRDKIEARIRTASPCFPRTMSDDARTFIAAALSKDPVERPTVLQLLQHPWVNTLRVRRSMRQLPTSAGGVGAAAVSKEATAKPSAGHLTASMASSPRGQLSSTFSSAAAATHASSTAALSATTPRKKVAVLVPEGTGPRSRVTSPRSPSNAATIAPAGGSPQGSPLSSPRRPPLPAGAKAAAATILTPAEAAIIAGSHRPLKLSSSLATKKTPSSTSSFSFSTGPVSPISPGRGEPSPRSPSPAAHGVGAASTAVAARLALASAKSSPLLSAQCDPRELVWLRGVGAAVPRANGAGDGAATGERARRKWLEAMCKGAR